MKKLHEVPNGTTVRVLDDVQVPPGAPPVNKGDVIFFDHIDGMYSYCLKGEEVVHLVAWTEVEIVN